MVRLQGNSTVVDMHFLEESLTSMWLLVSAFFVFFMQCGFALLEAGTVRAKNTRNILLKNAMDACVSGTIYNGHFDAAGRGMHSCDGACCLSQS
jgi:Amt family ammonium transporter